MYPYPFKCVIYVELYYHIGVFFSPTVGVNPKDVAHTSDCTRLVVANSGAATLNPSSNTFTDPEGSVTIIIRNDQGFPIEINMDFTQLNDR